MCSQRHPLPWTPAYSCTLSKVLVFAPSSPPQLPFAKHTLPHPSMISSSPPPPANLPCSLQSPIALAGICACLLKSPAATSLPLQPCWNSWACAFLKGALLPSSLSLRAGAQKASDEDKQPSCPLQSCLETQSSCASSQSAAEMEEKRHSSSRAAQALSELQYLPL